MAIKKTWYEIQAPAYFDEKVVGETPASDPKYLIGRVVSVSLADLQQDARKFYLKFSFRVVEVDGKAKTIFVGHDITSERIYRMVQKYSRRVDCIQDIGMKDGSKIRVKTILTIPKRVSTSVKDNVRKYMKSAVENALSESTMDSFIRSVIDGTLQSAIREECKKVYPVGAIEIRKSEVLKQPDENAAKKAKETKPEEKAEGKTGEKKLKKAKKEPMAVEKPDEKEGKKKTKEEKADADTKPEDSVEKEK